MRDTGRVFCHEWRVCTRSWLFVIYIVSLALGLGLFGWWDMEACEALYRRAEQARGLSVLSGGGFLPAEVLQAQRAEAWEGLVFILPAVCLPGFRVPGFHGTVLWVRALEVPWSYQDPIGGGGESYGASFHLAFSTLGSLLGLLWGLGGIVLARQGGTLKMVLGTGGSRGAVWWGHWLARVSAAWAGYLWAMAVLTAVVFVRVGLAELPRWMAVVGWGGLAMTAWVTLGTVLSALHRRWERALMTGLVVWSGLLWMVPRGAVLVADWTVPRPEEAVLIEKERYEFNRMEVEIARTPVVPDECRPGVDRRDDAQAMQRCSEALTRLYRDLRRVRSIEYLERLWRIYEDFIGGWRRWWRVAAALASLSPGFIWEMGARQQAGAWVQGVVGHLRRLWDFQRRVAGGGLPEVRPEWVGGSGGFSEWLGRMGLFIGVGAVVGAWVFGRMEI